MSLAGLLRTFEWVYTAQSVIGLALCLYATWEAYKDEEAASGGPDFKMHRLIVFQAYALAGSLGILHALLLYVGGLALLSALPPVERQAMTLRVIVAFVVAQFCAITLQAWVVHLRNRVRSGDDDDQSDTTGEGPLTPTIAVVNHSAAVSDAEVQACLADFQTQVTRDFAPAWGVGCRLVWVPQGSNPPAGAWQLAVLDDADQAGALGYHDVTPDGHPLGKVFVKTTVSAGEHWTVVFSHELLEMLGDPYIDSVTFLDDGQGGGWLIPVEVCDPVQGEEYAYHVGKTLVSDFVYPAWFRQGGTGPWDYGRHLSQSLYVLKDSYCSIAPVTLPQGWQQVFGDLTKGGEARPGGPVVDPDKAGDRT